MRLYKNKTKILIISHYSYKAEKGEDTGERTLGFFKSRTKRAVFISHPLAEFGNTTSYLTIYEDGKKTKKLKVNSLNNSMLLMYLQHIFITFYFLLVAGFKYDLCIAFENLSFTSLFPLRLAGFIKKIVYYSVDFSPKRFTNKLLNSIYHYMDKFSCKYSDANWVMVREQIKERKKYGITKTNSSPFSLVPIGYETKKINVLPTDKIDYYNIVYVGGLRKSYGPQLAIQALPELVKKIPEIRLTIIGAGNYEGRLKKLIKRLGVSKYADFRGFMPGFKELTETIAKKSIGLAPYAPIPGSYSYYSDPSKIKLYMVCGLPVITTSVATMSTLISKTGSGVVIKYSKESLVKAITDLLSNKKRYERYKNAAIELSATFDINNILSSTVRKIS